jgi:exodeoxyribonuclease-5
MEMSGDQRLALDNLLNWYKSKAGQYITLGGYAGTGKTTLIAILRQKLRKVDKKIKVAFVSYTGKAARVLKNKLEEQKVVDESDFVGTIHSLIYSPIVNDKKEITGWKKKEVVEQDLIIIDEASMVAENIWQDLLSFNRVIIAVGDHGQLPPIEGRFNLMEKPVLKLTEIHRQARNNPIIKLSIWAREKGVIAPGIYGKGIKKLNKRDSWVSLEVEEELRNYRQDTMVLCGYNRTRVELNKFIRNNLGFETVEPRNGDKVICLRNNHSVGIFNGMTGIIGVIDSKNDDWWEAEIEMDDGIYYSGMVAKGQFGKTEGINFTYKRGKYLKGDLFDFGYALTVHKAQGSQARKVILFEERFSKMNDDDWRRWLYTGITRAEEELCIIG